MVVSSCFSDLVVAPFELADGQEPWVNRGGLVGEFQVLVHVNLYYGEFRIGERSIFQLFNLITWNRLKPGICLFLFFVVINMKEEPHSRI